MNVERNENTKHMLEELKAPDEPLTTWEESFVASVSDYFDRKGMLTERQYEVLKKIYDEKVG